MIKKLLFMKELNETHHLKQSRRMITTIYTNKSSFVLWFSVGCCKIVEAASKSSPNA